MRRLYRKAKLGNLLDGSDCGLDSETRELVMENFGYSKCMQCDEEYVFIDASKCARCLGLGFAPIDDEDSKEEPSNFFLEHLAAA
jgi:hypothetical protein